MFTYPNPVNDNVGRAVASGVVLMCVAAIAFDQPWILIPLTFGFWARVLAGPRFSPLALLASRVVVPWLGRAPKPVPGPPKRFAQGIGVVFSTSALILAYGFGLTTAAWVVVAMLTCAAFLEAAFGICLGCKAFSLLMRAGVIPESVCEECADLSKRHPQLADSATR
ncbi:MAG TPA: DUF4395 domain-containing protein [Acidimicrobiales bacterium]